MNKLFSIVCISFLIVSCKDSSEKSEPTVAKNTTATESLTTLEKALAVFDEPQIGDEEEFLRMLEIARFLPELNKEQVLQVYEKIITHRVLNRDAIVLTIQRLTRIDAIAAKDLVSKIQGLEKYEMNYLQALITYTSNEKDLPSLVNYFKANYDDIEDMYCSSFHGDALIWHFWFNYYKSHPKRIDDNGDLDEAYALARIRRGEFDHLNELSKEYRNDINELSDIEDMILDYGVFSDRNKVSQWNKRENFKAQKKYSESINRFQNISESSHINYDTLKDSERDLLCVADLNPNSILLNLDKLTHLPPQNYERILSITTEWRRYHMWSELSTCASYYYSKQDALAAYKAIYDPTYSRSTHMTTFPLLELVKTQPELAAQEYGKLAKWPLITPTPLYPILAENLSFSFCYHLAMSAPEKALKLGGKYLDYPRARGMSIGPNPLTGIAYGLCKTGKEQKLVDILLNAPNEWAEEEVNFDYKAEDALEGIAIYSLEKWQNHVPKLAAKYDLDISEGARQYLYNADPASSIEYLKSLPVDEESPDEVQDYLSCVYERNPILAYRLAEKHGLTIRQLNSD